MVVDLTYKSERKNAIAVEEQIQIALHYYCFLWRGKTILFSEYDDKLFSFSVEYDDDICRRESMCALRFGKKG